jgi:hypothetical protein
MRHICFLSKGKKSFTFPLSLFSVFLKQNDVISFKVLGLSSCHLSLCPANKLGSSFRQKIESRVDRSHKYLVIKLLIIHFVLGEMNEARKRAPFGIFPSCQDWGSNGQNSLGLCFLVYFLLCTVCVEGRGLGFRVCWFLDLSCKGQEKGEYL